MRPLVRPLVRWAVGNVFVKFDGITSKGVQILNEMNNVGGGRSGGEEGAKTKKENRRGRSNDEERGTTSKAQRRGRSNGEERGTTRKEQRRGRSNGEEVYRN